MGMFDDKHYLTGDNGTFNEGDSFYLIGAAHAGIVKINGEPRSEVCLTIAREPGADTEKFYTSGKGIVNQVDRLEPGDLPARVVLVAKDTGSLNKMFLLEPYGRSVEGE